MHMQGVHAQHHSNTSQQQPHVSTITTRLNNKKTIQSTPRHIHHTKYTTPHTPYKVHHATYTIQSTPRHIHHTKYTTPHTPYKVHHATYTIQSTPYKVHHTKYTIQCTPYKTHPPSITHLPSGIVRVHSVEEKATIIQLWRPIRQQRRH